MIGVEDPEFGQAPACLRRPRPAIGDATPKEIKDYVKSNLARYKVPREVVFIDELPRNATGKILRKKLVEWE